ncbi:MAG: hypothetical protein JSV90_02470 [Methanobacteriota archaeon]|nr:MAG: hypothetical protein JSV90_02470 [Euryarchaeota archaeon]
MAKWHKIAAASIATVAVVLLAYAIISERTDEGVSTPGMGDRHVYSSTGLAIIVVSSFLIAIALMFILLREEYEPLPPSMAPARPPPPPPKEEGRDEGARHDTADAPSADYRARERYLVLRLLSGDERTMYKAVMDAGGEALQKNLIKATGMSNAKVSRVLDRLDEKGVITKQRHGSTNLVKIVLQDE